MKLVHISDTHLQLLPELPEGDILIHSGDALNYGNIKELFEFEKQLKEIHSKFKHIIFVPGNHDRIFEAQFENAENILKSIPNLIILHNKAIELEGIKFYGTADQPAFCNWAFNVRDNLELYERYLKIPEDTNVLITHCPPEGILDRTMCGEKVGSRALKLALSRLTKLKAHLFGHIHYSNGLDYINEVWYSNSAICGENYQPVNTPRVIEI